MNKEARSIASLDHPGNVTLYDFGHISDETDRRGGGDLAGEAHTSRWCTVTQPVWPPMQEDWKTRSERHGDRIIEPTLGLLALRRIPMGGRP